MNQDTLTPFKDQNRHARFRSAGFAALILVLASSANAQSHDGHDHAEEAQHGETHQAHAGHDQHGDDEHTEHAQEDVVQLTPEIRREFGIALARVGPGLLHEEVVLPGEIKFNANQIAYATPRYAGTIQQIHVHLGDRVEKGELLAELESTDTLRPFSLKAPIDGVVVAYDLTPGQTVAAGQSLFTVADLSTVWADLRIYQRDIPIIREGQSVRISSGHDDHAKQERGKHSFAGRITYIAPVIDEHTRTGLARVVVDNADGQWKPGQFIKGSVAVDEHQADLVVPHSAVIPYEGQQVVFIQTEEGFEPRPVVLGHSDSAAHAVESGLEAGDTIVIRNPMSIKAELGKGSFGGHNH